MRYGARLYCLLMVAASVVMVVGCGADDPATPPAQESTGTIVIHQIPPDLADANWTLTGPESKSGSGDQTLERIRPGSYVVAWDSVFGFATPPSDTKTLYAHRSITFSGSYMQQTGTIVIDQTPIDLPEATWTLTGPVQRSGSGTMNLQGMPIGDYSLTWNDVDLYSRPDDQTLTLDPDETITFNGKYTYQFGTIVIAQMPVDLPGVAWTLTGAVQATGSGSRTLTDMPLGDYTVTLTAVEGYNGGGAPNAATRTLGAEQRIIFAGTYFLYIPPGSFWMGSPEDEPGRNSDEALHEVTLTRGFYISPYEATLQWWHQVMDWEETVSQAPRNYVTWDMAVQFCNTLSLIEGLDPAYIIHGPVGDVTWNRNADGYRLPTEAEWEYACRAGSQTAFANGPITVFWDECEPIDENLDRMAWYCGNNMPNYTKPVGSKTPNAWGIFDMHGNVWEWVWDGYRPDYENLSPIDPVQDAAAGAIRVFRGGNWNSRAYVCRSAHRNANLPNYGICIFGVRPVRTAF